MTVSGKVCIVCYVFIKPFVVAVFHTYILASTCIIIINYKVLSKHLLHAGPRAKAIITQSVLDVPCESVDITTLDVHFKSGLVPQDLPMPNTRSPPVPKALYVPFDPPTGSNINLTGVSIDIGNRDGKTFASQN